MSSYINFVLFFVFVFVFCFLFFWHVTGFIQVFVHYNYSKLQCIVLKNCLLKLLLRMSTRKRAVYPEIPGNGKHLPASELLSSRL